MKSIKKVWIVVEKLADTNYICTDIPSILRKEASVPFDFYSTFIISDKKKALQNWKNNARGRMQPKSFKILPCKITILSKIKVI